MGARNYLIDGVSGAGKTAVAAELHRRGHHAIHGDRELAYCGDPHTGLPMTPEAGEPTAAWMAEHHIWDVANVRAHLANHEAALTFFCGGAKNFSDFIDLFDGVFVLEGDRETMNWRIERRVAMDPTDFGGTSEERVLIERLFATNRNIHKNATCIDATAPVTQVVDQILSHCSEGDSRIDWDFPNRL